MDIEKQKKEIIKVIDNVENNIYYTSLTRFAKFAGVSVSTLYKYLYCNLNITSSTHLKFETALKKLRK